MFFGSETGGLEYVDVAKTLKKAMNQNQSLNVFIASRYYDLDTSYFAAKYTVNHLGLDPSLRNNIVLAYYDSGHQIYSHLPSLKKLKSDALAFMKRTLEPRR